MTKILGSSLPNIPWEDRPAGYKLPVWRYSGNPIIGRDGNRRSNSVFNSAVVPYKGGFAGLFRCDSRSVSMDLFAGFSDDGVNWKIDDDPISFADGDAEIVKREYRYDPRVCLLDGKYYITWCNGYHGPTIGVGWTEDFRTFHQLENAFLPYNRNGVLFPRKIGGMYAMLSRPSDTGHTPFGDIFISRSPDMTFWGMHRHVMSTVPGDRSAWQSTKIGAGPIPHRDGRGLAAHLPRRYHQPATAMSTAWAPPCWTATSPGRCSAAARTTSLRPMSSMSAWATCRTSPSPAPRSPMRTPAASPSTMAAPTP